MVAIPDTQADSQDEDPQRDLQQVNEMLADWAARSATTSEALVERFEAMGYPVRGKSEDEIAEILRRPPTRPVGTT
ncbi:hypothetical protein MKK69_09320 [Methylobacterium sp. J-026]|uniref:hypothetical protein n=1 Tax=Methylobacterium sp. J-026 TaxID=2836624 RepID=UPI001FBA9D9C|nr:hypothetical protein [Methylobacterium sp. J-026]MCJ2134252.1 hypothetical protein [Methylobacterium sp. J-026]